MANLLLDQRIPDYVLRGNGVKTAREYRSLKRAQAKAVHKLLDGGFRLGCAWTPGYPHIIDRVEKALIDLREALKVKNWERAGK